jgi:hypothetical protein
VAVFPAMTTDRPNAARAGRTISIRAEAGQSSFGNGPI